jgi:hypothetical protein
VKDWLIKFDRGRVNSFLQYFTRVGGISSKPKLVLFLSFVIILAISCSVVFYKYIELFKGEMTGQPLGILFNCIFPMDIKKSLNMFAIS